ncbi:MAG: GatB/YqeY domain-containing protein [Nitrospirota bacterium]|nr:GatB/YqeY domain-containing protein [Nitrospirota bacterium]
MTLRETIQEDTKAAMKSGDKAALGTLRMVSAALKNRKIELLRELTDEDALAVIRTGIKQRRDAITQFRDGGRAELAAQEEAEVAVLERYLPAQMPDAELDAIVARVIADSGATGMKDMGGVMKQVLTEVAGRADGSAVSARVKQRLA